MRRTAVIAGVGPGLAEPLARRFEDARPGTIADACWHLVELGVNTMSFEVHVTNGNENIEVL